MKISILEFNEFEAKILKYKIVKVGGKYSCFTVNKKCKNIPIGYDKYEDLDMIILDRINNETISNANPNKNISKGKEKVYNSKEQYYDLKQKVSVPEGGGSIPKVRVLVSNGEVTIPNGKVSVDKEEISVPKG